MSQTSPFRVLHVEDEQDWQQIVAILLKPLGLIIDHVDSVSEAQSALRQASLASVTPYSLVITDGDLGNNETGRDILLHVRTNYSGTPVITLSSQERSYWEPLGNDMLSELQHIHKMRAENIIYAVKRALGLA